MACPHLRAALGRIGVHVDEIAQLVAELHQHPVALADQTPPAVLFRAVLFTAFHDGSQAQEGVRAGHRQPLRTQVVQGGLAQVDGTVADVDQGDAARAGGTGEGDHAGHGAGLAFLHPGVPARVVVFAAVADQAGLVGRVVEHGFVDVQDHGGWAFGAGWCALGGDQRVPVGLCQGRVQVLGGGPVGLLGHGAVLDRALQPQHGVEVVVGRSGRRRGGWRGRAHGLAGGQGQCHEGAAREKTHNGPDSGKVWAMGGMHQFSGSPMAGRCRFRPAGGPGTVASAGGRVGEVSDGAHFCAPAACIPAPIRDRTAINDTANFSGPRLLPWFGTLVAKGFVAVQHGAWPLRSTIRGKRKGASDMTTSSICIHRRPADVASREWRA